jgi:hypothetical protein
MASDSDALWFRVDNKNPYEVDLDNTFFFGDIKAVEHFEDKFYILANRLNETVG